MEAYIVTDGFKAFKRTLGRTPESALRNYLVHEEPNFSDPPSIDALTIVQLREVHSFPVKQDAALMRLFTKIKTTRGTHPA